MKNVSFFLLSLWLCPMIIMAQSRIEKASSPDFMLSNTTALNAGITSRMFFKTGNYYTGGIATVGVGTSNARLSFYTQASADMNALAERMTITNNGFVGIANNSPLYPLHLKHGGIGFSQESPTGGAKIGFYTNGGTAYVQTHNNIPLYFTTNNASAQMTLTTTGRLGINTTTPVSRFEVKGKTTLNQQGDDAALEINGAIRSTGSNPAAFVVVAENPNWIEIDNPTSNGNPDAIILVTNRSGNTVYEGTVRLSYSTFSQRWLILPTGKGFNGFYQDEIDFETCDGGCISIDGIPTGGFFYEFAAGMEFNVLVIDK